MTRMSDPPMLAQIFEQPEESFANPYFEAIYKPEGASPAIGYLAHESCPHSGEVLVCGGNLAMRLAVIETKGITRENMTLEDIADRIDEIFDLTDMQVCELGLPPS
jgi:hypothetical protein